MCKLVNKPKVIKTETYFESNIPTYQFCCQNRDVQCNITQTKTNNYFPANPHLCVCYYSS